MIPEYEEERTLSMVARIVESSSSASALSLNRLWYDTSGIVRLSMVHPFFSISFLACCGLSTLAATKGAMTFNHGSGNLD